MYFGAILMSVMLFCVIILCLAVPQKHSRKILGGIAALTAVAALVMYGYGYCYEYLVNGQYTFSTCILRTVFDACLIFVGSNNWDAIKEAYEHMGTRIPEITFWIVHLAALTTSASAVIISLGSGLLKRMKLWVLYTRDITLIFGVSDHTLEFGRELAGTRKHPILYLDPNNDVQLHPVVDQIGAIVRYDQDALNGSLRFLRSIGFRPGKRKLFVYALDQSMLANQMFARRLMASMEARGIMPEQTALTIIAMGEDTDDPMQANRSRYGYGSVLSINEPQLVARIMIRSQPPYKSMTFDKNGRVIRDFHGIVVGFGQVGQAVLRQLVMNSQFQGGSSKIAVFAPDYEKQMGWISHECSAMMEHYNISMYPYEGRSQQLYDYLTAHISTVNYLAICTGKDTLNLEIGEKIQNFLHRRGCDAPILLCSHSGVSPINAREHVETHRIYTPEILCTAHIDHMAMVLNQIYKQKGDIRENWRSCSYFERMSSRTAADFYDAILHCAGVTQEQALHDWNPQGELLENLAANEHLRWNAFHYCMGFRPMTEAEFEERCRIYRKNVAANQSGYQIRKDEKQRVHACIIPWEALDAYSQKENAVTGGNANYAENDRNSVRDLVKVLQAMQEIQ